MNPLLPPFLWPSEEAREETSRRITLLKKQKHGLKVRLQVSVLNMIPQKPPKVCSTAPSPAACPLTCPVWKIRSVSPTPTLVSFVSQSSQPYWQSKTITYKANQHFEHFFPVVHSIWSFCLNYYFALVLLINPYSNRSQKSKLRFFLRKKKSLLI